MEKKIELMIKKIEQDPVWLESVKKQAEEKGITLEEALYNNAVYTIKVLGGN